MTPCRVPAAASDRTWVAESIATARRTRGALLALSVFGYAVALANTYALQLELYGEVEAEVWLAEKLAPGGPGHDYVATVRAHLTPQA